MNALQELPERDKDHLSPLFQLRPWGASRQLDNSASRLEEAFGRRPQFLELCPEEPPKGPPRPVHSELEELRNPADGNAAWCEYIKARENLIPALLISGRKDFIAQGAYFTQLGRGMILRIPLSAIGTLTPLCIAVAEFTDSGHDVIIVLDFERQTRDLLGRLAQATGYVEAVRRMLPNAFISFSASSFPETFTTIEHQDIFERQFFDGLAIHVGAEKLIYSDRGSARAERQKGGGGAPAPRIDYVLPSRWTFFRSEEGGDRPTGYQTQARQAMASNGWDAELRLWGSQMIERTAAGDQEAINSPARSTAARINIHLHRQLFYGDDAGLYDTDEDWTD